MISSLRLNRRRVPDLLLAAKEYLHKKLFTNVTQYNLPTIFLGLVFTLTAFANNNGDYPIKVNLITRQEATYQSPENTYAAMLSSLFKRDLEWHYQTATVESAMRSKKLYEDAGISPEKMFDMMDEKEEFYILKKINYKDSVMLIVRSQKLDGTIMQGAVPFTLENSKWKTTDIYAADKEFHEYLDYFKRAPLETQTSVSYNGVRYDRKTRQFYSDATITNISDKTLEGPVWLKIKNLQPGDAKLVNADGMHFNEPYIIMLEEEEKWLPGQALPSKTLYFTNPERERITFDDIVFAVEPEEGS